MDDPFFSDPLMSWTATVTNIVDGDTFDVDWTPGDEPPGGLLDRIRIAGVDTNETNTVPSEAFGEEAKTRLAELLPIGTVVRLEAQDETSSTLNRPVRHVFINGDGSIGSGDNIAEILVEEGLGLAVSYDFEPNYRTEYFFASETAQIAEVGMWEEGAAGGNPGTWPDIEMVVNYDAAGDDAANLNDEYIQIRNSGPGVLDLSDWTARSSARLDSATITIPNGTTVPVGGTFRIYVGTGTDTATEMYLDQAEPIFDNSGDVVYLRDTDLNIRATQLWPANLTKGPEFSIVIDDVQFNAPGDDATNPNGEWVVIRNAGASTVDLTDWRLKDDGFDYAFDDGETLAAGEQLRIFVGSGADSGPDRYWGNSEGILNNDGGILRIWTPQSQEVDAYAWGTEDSVAEDPRGALRMFANFNASGNDTTNPNGEWVAIWNTSDSTIDLSGYKLESNGDVYTFANGVDIDPNQNIRVRVGDGTDTSSNKYWGNSAGIFSNSGEYVDLIDASDETLLRHEWPATAGLTDYGLVIDAVNYDAPGNDSTNPNGEWIVIRNTSTSEQNLRNWKIVVGSNQLVSLADRPIAPGDTVTIYMGDGTNTEDTIYWGKDSGILFNSGSRAVQLLSPERALTSGHSWGSADAGVQSVPAALDISINYDATGTDSANPNGEWVNLENISSSTVSLNGFQLYTDGTAYDFDAGDTLDPGERMRVYRGTGADSGLDRYAPGLNEFANSADEILLRPVGSEGTAKIFSYPDYGLLPVEPTFEIASVNFDAVGSDASNPNGEWIDITNTGSKAADLRDWRVQYKTSTFYDVNDSIVISAGDTVRLFIGNGTDTNSSLFWGFSSGILSNTAGDVTLLSKFRNVADTQTW